MLASEAPQKHAHGGRSMQRLANNNDNEPCADRTQRFSLPCGLHPGWEQRSFEIVMGEAAVYLLNVMDEVDILRDVNSNWRSAVP